MVKKSVMIWGCENIDDCGTYRFPGFRPGTTVQGIFGDPKARVVYLHRRGKKGWRSLRHDRARVVRSQAALGAGFGVWRLSNLFGDRGASNRLPPMLEGEARETGVARGQSVLQQAICLLCGTALPGYDDQRRCSRNPLELENHQRAGQAVHARATP